MALVVAVWLLAGSATHLSAQTKRDTGPAEKANKGLSLKEARRLAVDNSYDLLQAKKQLMDKKITRTQYDARVARLLADVEEAYMDLYVAQEELRVVKRRAAAGSPLRMGSRRAASSTAKPPATPQVAEQDKALAQARQLADFIPLEHAVKLQELQLRALFNSKTYPLRSDTELVLADRPVAMKKEIDVDALIDKALDRPSHVSPPPGPRGRAAHTDRTPADADQDKKRTIVAVERAALRAIASIKRLEIATQVKEIQQKKLELLRTAKADPAEIAAAEEALEDAELAELRAIVANNSDILDLAEITGTLQKDLGTNLGD
jgi:hypothetical protein